MFGSVVLCCWSFSLLRLSSSLVHGNIQLDDGPAAGRRTETSYLSDIERGHAPDPVHDPALLPVDSVEDHFLMDTGSYDEVAVADLKTQYTPGLVSSLAAAGSGHAFTSSLHPSPAVMPGLPTALLRPLRHLLLPLLQRHLLLSPSRPRLPSQTHLNTPEANKRC
ncbi:agouti-related protein isoform X1 [Trachinotus anak]|uniref:agouti-related protein isoform X1 n=1 Tax=Trachinotus anak TaxID=443729 RepID=UPI0039F1F9B4